MWPFTRKSKGAAAGSSRPHDEWRELDPLESTIGPAPLTIPPSFGPGLAGRQNPELTSEPLGHQVSLSAPSGLVLNLATPIPSRTGGPALTTRRPTQRRPTVPSSPTPASILTTLEPDTTLEPVHTIPIVSSRPSVASAVASSTEAAPGSVAPEMPGPLARRPSLGQTRRLGLGPPLGPGPGVQRAPIEPSSASALEEIPSGAEIASQPPAAAPAAASAGPSGPAAPGAAPFAGFVAGAARVAAAAAAPAAELVSELPLARSAAVGATVETAITPGPAGGPVPMPYPNLDTASTPLFKAAAPAGTETRPASGAPMSSLAPTPFEPGAAAPLSGETIPPLARVEDVLTQRAPMRVESGSEPSGDAREPELPLAHRASAASDEMGGPGASVEADASDEAAEPSSEPWAGADTSEAEGESSVQASRELVGPALDEHRVAPIVGAQPLRPTAAARGEEAVPSMVSSRMRVAFGVDPGTPRVHRDGAALAESRRLEARAFTRGGDVFLPSMAGSLESTGTQALLAHELTHVAQQREFGNALPGESTPLGQELEAQAQDVERRWSSSASLPLAPAARGASTGDRREAVAAPMFSPSATRWAPAESSASSPASPMPGSTLGGPSSEPQRAPMVDPPSLTSARERGSEFHDEGHGIQDLDELARKLYERIRSRLRGELLVDRERAGMLTGGR